MKTILVFFTQVKIEDIRRINRSKKYAFVTSNEVNVGDLLSVPTLSDKNIQISQVIDTECKYVNTVTGDLKDEFNSPNDIEIRELRISEQSESIVIAHKIN